MRKTSGEGSQKLISGFYIHNVCMHERFSASENKNAKFVSPVGKGKKKERKE